MRIRRQTACLLMALLLLFPFILPAAADGTVLTVRVLLQSLQLTDRIDLYPYGPYTAECEGTEVYLPDGIHCVAQLREGSIFLHIGGAALRAGSRVTLRQNASGLSGAGLRFIEGGNVYPGDLVLTAADGRLRAVSVVNAEDYLMGVVPFEMADSFPLEALKAQAVCARTYALSKRGAAGEWDMTDTTADQVYRGVSGANTRAAAAVAQTAGIVAMYK